MVPTALFIAYFVNLNQIDSESNPDSKGYVTFAISILSGDIFEKQQLRDIGWTRAVRTPGYPLLVAAAMGSTAGDLNNVAHMHLLFGLLSIVVLPLLLRHYCHPLITASAVLVVQLLMRSYFTQVLTEWVAFNLVLIVLGLLVKALCDSSIKTMFALGLIAALLVLIRPAMLPMMFLMPLVLIYRRRVNLRNTAILASTTLPVLLWMSFNLYHIDAFTLAQLRGYQLFSVGTQVGYAEAMPGDSDELKHFIKEVNDRKRPPMGQEDEYIDNLDSNYKMIYMLNSLIVTQLTTQRLGVIAVDREYMEVYGKRAILSNLRNYGRYIQFSLKQWLAYGVPPFVALLILVVPAACLLRHKITELATATIVLFVIHLSVGTIVSMVEGISTRYLLPTFYPYVVAVICCFFGGCFANKLPLAEYSKRLLERRFRAQSTRADDNDSTVFKKDA